MKKAVFLQLASIANEIEASSEAQKSILQVRTIVILSYPSWSDQPTTKKSDSAACI